MTPARHETDQPRREIERKYESMVQGDPFTLPDLTGLDRIAAVRDRGTVELEALYYDTADRRLDAHGITLRSRTGGADAGWHLKLPVGPDTREEFQRPPGPKPPAELTSLVRAVTRDAPLRPLMRIVSVRQIQHLLDAHGSLLAEASVDQVLAERPGGAGAAWTEAEVELADGVDPALLDATEERLRQAGLGRSSSPSKLAAALARTAQEETDRDGRTPGGTPGAARRRDAAAAPGTDLSAAPGPSAAPDPETAGGQLLVHLTAQRDALVHLDPAVRRNLPDAVHQMRVTTRRLRSCLRSYRALLDPTATDPLRAELKWLAAELGKERDLEVLAHRLGALLADHTERAPHLVHGPVPDRVTAWADAHRGDAHDHVRTVLDGARYLALLDALDALLDRPPLRRAARSRPAGPLAAAVSAEHRRLARALDAAERAPEGPERDDALHEARKKAKRVRYATEAAEGVLGKRARRLRKALKGLQQLLGDHQDSVLVRGALIRIAEEAHSAGEPTFTYGVLHAAEEERARRSERALPEVRRKVHRKADKLRS